jgi:two-component system OmpR family response regulator
LKVSKVLIVQDDDVAAETYERALRFDGFDVVTAHDAETGLDALEVHRPDVVLIDLQLPLADGITLVRRVRIRDCKRHIPVAIITADYRVPWTVENDLNELEAHLFYKPLWIEHLVTIARELARRST